MFLISMKLESELEVKQLEILIEGMKKIHLSGCTMSDALLMIKACDFLQRQITEYRKPQPMGVVSSDPTEIGKKVTPITPPGKKK